MADIEKELQELRREVIESRNLVIKTDNLLKNLQSDLKVVTRKQESFERKSWANGATAYILFMTLAALGAYMFAKGAVARHVEALEHEKVAKQAAVTAREEVLANEAARTAASKKALAVFELLVSGDPGERERAVEEALAFDASLLSPLEAQALKDKALSLRQQVADAALESGRAAFNRRDYKQAAADLARHVKVSPKAPEDVALLLLGQSQHSLRSWAEAAETLTEFLKRSPNSRSADYVTLILGESLAESGKTAEAISVYRQGAQRFSSSQFAPWMRTRAKRLEGGE